MSGADGLRVGVSPGEVRAVAWRGGTAVAVAVERGHAPDGVGDLHRARVAALAPAMGGAFLALPDGATGFLPETELPRAEGAPRRPIGRALAEGEALAVRVTRAAQGGKGPRLTARLAAPEAALVAAAPAGAPRLVRRGPEAALRLALSFPELPVTTDSPALAARLRPLLGDRLALVPVPALGEAEEELLDDLAGSEVAMPGGGRLLVHPTPALVALDLDAGAAAGARDPDAQRRANLGALPEIARQIALRDLAGPILLDFAGLKPAARQALAEPLRLALAADPLVRLLGLTHLGLAEMVRTRIHPPLHETLGWPPSPLTHGLAGLRALGREEAVSPGRRRALRAAPVVLAALRAVPGALAEAAAASGRPPALRPDPTLPAARWSVEENADG